MNKKLKIFDIVNSKKSILKEFYRKDCSEIFKNSILFGKGGTGTAYKKGDLIIKKQPLYSQHPEDNEIFYERHDKCIFIKEAFLLEGMVMQTLSPITVLIPRLHDIFIMKEKNKWYSVIVMDQQNGIQYSKYRNGITNEELCKSWYHFIEDMKLLYQSYRFLHGDLIQDNIIVEYGRLKLIDFGLSFIMIDKKLIMRHHIIPRLIKLNGGSTELKMSQISSIDICKLLYHYKSFSKKFDLSLDTCEGITGKRIKQKHYPNPVYIHSPELTFDSALSELRRCINSDTYQHK